MIAVNGDYYIFFFLFMLAADLPVDRLWVTPLLTQ
jgi:hypothetical protein